MAAGNGKYGLQLRGAAKPLAKPIAKPAFFQDDEDEDTVERQLAREAAKKKKLKEVEEQHRRALEEDPHAFDYDGVYDQMKAEQARPLQKMQQKKEARYIPRLIEKAKLREREHEIIYERQLAKEREKDEHLYQDKEKFLTAAYKRKLAEREEMEREQRLLEMKEKAEEVTKREDLSDFYRNLTRNVAFGGGEKSESKRPERRVLQALQNSKQEEANKTSKQEKETSTAAPPQADAVGSPSPKSDMDAKKMQHEEQQQKSQAKLEEGDEVKKNDDERQPPEETRKQSEEEVRKAREAAARERFLARKKQRASNV